MIRAGNIHINPAAVASMEWDRRHYMNAAPDETLVVRMTNGAVYRIHHEPQYLGGANAYEVERQILSAAEEK